jgi:maltokinase
MTTLHEHLLEWVPRQRWYTNKGRTPALTEIGSWDVPSGDSAATIAVHLLRDDGGEHPVLFQVPVTTRKAALAAEEGALIGASGDTFYYDAPHDPAFAAAVLALMLEPAAAGVRPEHAVRGTALNILPARTVASSRVLSGEQSNTSIIVDLVDDAGAPGMPVICKLFRVLHAGDNPDVAVQHALSLAGSSHVPTPLGYLTGHWQGARGLEHGHVAFAQEFLPGVQDAWRVALAAAEADEDFGARAYALGTATASVHTDLARAFPTEAATPALIAGLVDGMLERYRIARGEIPALAEFGAAVEAIFLDARSRQWPPLQRVHGDYHLGQVLDAPGRGWMLIDFEGEPLRPMEERTRPDAALRDVAGMLRSLSYVAGSVTLSGHNPDDAAAWAATARRSFLDGYAAASGADLERHRPVLDALELDKAIYEVRYEARNRPHWLPIPLTAVRRLVGMP